MAAGVGAEREILGLFGTNVWEQHRCLGRVEFAVFAGVQRLEAHLHRSHGGKCYGRWGVGEITNDLKDSMDLSVPRSESQRTQRLAHGRVREGKEMETWLRWARRGKGCSVLAHCAGVACAESRKESGLGEADVSPRVLRKPQFQILFPPASSVTLADVRWCVPILVSRNKQRSTEVLDCACDRNPWGAQWG